MAKSVGSWRIRAGCAVVAVLVVSSCYRPTQPTPATTSKPAKSTSNGAKPAKATPSQAKTSSAKPAKTKKTPKVVYSPTHDEEVNEIFDLAKKGRWEEAETRAAALWARDPQDSAAIRLRDSQLGHSAADENGACALERLRTLGPGLLPFPRRRPARAGGEVHTALLDRRFPPDAGSARSPRAVRRTGSISPAPFPPVLGE